MRHEHDSRNWLFENMAPEELISYVDAENEKLGWRFVTAREAKGLREAWVLGRVARLLGADTCRLARQDPPDGYMGFVDVSPIPVEVTELLQPGRQRGAEGEDVISHQAGCELDEAIECNLRWLREAVSRKLLRDANYPPGTVLIVYHNTDLYRYPSIWQ